MERISLKPRAANAETNEVVMKLKQLASTTSVDHEENGDGFALYTYGYPSLLYGRWLRDYAKSPPAVWRKCFRARILEQMNGLSDDDPTNDTAACSELAVSLFQAGDRKNAGLILAVLFGTLKKYMADKAEQKNVEIQVEEGRDDTRAVKELDALPSHMKLAYADVSPTNGHEKPLVGPHNCIVKSHDTLESKGQTSKLALQLESDAWSYGCDVCGRDAEDAGTM